MASATVIGVILLGDGDDPPDQPGVITVPDFGLSAGAPAPDFSITLLDGSVFSLSDHVADDGRPVILNLWASWCAPCREEMPYFDAAAASHPGVFFLGVAVEDDPAAARDFADEIAVSYALAIDEADRVARRYPAFGLPATFLIAGDGTLARTVYGPMDEDDIAEMLAQLDAGFSGAGPPGSALPAP